MATAVVSDVVERIEPDTAVPVNEYDSALGSETESTRSASITSSITGYKYENGRRYHAYREGAYYLPNDEAEQARLDLVHHVFRLSLDGSLTSAPIKDVKRCLDFGTGTGIWAIDFAEEFPDTEVIGTDLSPIQPTWVPPNLKFYIDDVEDDWAYSPDDRFDFIHERCMGGSIKDWNVLAQRCYDNLLPGGWCEFQEYEGWFFSDTDPKLSKTPAADKWITLVNEASSQFGKELDIAPRMKQLFEDTGFVDIKQKVIHIPIGPWAKGTKAKEMGAFHREEMCDAIDSFTPALFTRVLGWTSEECKTLITQVKDIFRDPQYQLYTKFWFVCGRKPE